MNATKKPNFLFIFPDQHRGDWMPYPEWVFKKLGMEKLPLKMPNIERLMENGVTFTNCITPSPLCSPARACLASGLRYARAGCYGNNMNYQVEHKTYYTTLKEQGYSVGGCGKFDLHKADQDWGIDGWDPFLGKIGFDREYSIDNAGKFDAVRSVRIKKTKLGNQVVNNQDKYEPRDPYMSFLKSRGLAKIHVDDFGRRTGLWMYNSEPTPLPEDAYCDNWVTEQGIRILQSFPRDKPWHLVVNFVCPHNPWDVTERMRKNWENVDFPPANKNDTGFDEPINEVRQNYAAMLENIDRCMGLLIEEVEKRGELVNTIIIYSSDHGEMLGDFNKWGKHVPERGSIRVPLVISGPGIKKGEIFERFVETQDLVSTMIDYAGGIMPEAKDSISLRPVLEGSSTTHRDHAISHLEERKKKMTPWKSIMDETYKLVLSEGNEPELYNWIEDPWENENIAGENPEIVKKLRERLDSV
ncbi:MAG: sulfatase [Candidatus Hodarchaeota archaeon]